MSSRALIVPIVDLEPNPPPYGELRLRKGAWDQLLANKAYHASSKAADSNDERATGCNLEI